MLADTAGSILTGVSALGTLILAFATFYLARSAVQGRLDGLAPRVVVTKLTVEDQALSYPTKLPGIPQPFTGEWNMTLQGDHRLGIRASGQVRNESEVTALMQFDLPADHQVTEVVKEADTGSGPGPNGLTLQGGWWVLPPKTRAFFKLTWWRPAKEWMQSTERAGSDAITSTPTTHVQLRVRGASGKTVDTWDLGFGSYVVQPNPTKDGWVVCLGLPTSPPGSIPYLMATVGLMQRRYPWRTKSQ